MKSVRALSFLLFIIAVLVLGPNGFASADSGGSKAGEALNMEVIGHNELVGRGFNADDWVCRGYAYVGQWG